jgi:hypothetical protein
MQRCTSLKIFFWLQSNEQITSLLRLSRKQSDPSSQHLPACPAGRYLRFIGQLQVRACKRFLRYATALLFISFISTQELKAQVDSNYVDTTSMRDTTAIVAPHYDDQDDGYVDTTVKHIYDTSQYFFNWKSYYDDPFISKKIKQGNRLDEEVSAFKKQDDFWYIPAIEKIETRIKTDPKFRDSLMNVQNKGLKDERENSLLYQSWFNTLIWIIAIGIFAAALIYFLVQNKISIFSKASEIPGEEDTGEVHEDIFRISYSKLIQSAEKEKDYRVAIRLMFLQTLKIMSEAGIIQYQPDYTDLHYLQQLEQSEYYNEFFKVMRSYEYVWYGKFAISTEQYTTVKNNFIKLQHKI